LLVIGSKEARSVIVPGGRHSNPLPKGQKGVIPTCVLHQLWEEYVIICKSLKGGGTLHPHHDTVESFHAPPRDREDYNGSAWTQTCSSGACQTSAGP
jgi:hypothetical protein